MTTPAVPSHPNFPPQQRWFRLRKWLIRLFWAGVCLSVATVIWGLWYVNDRGFTRKWRRLVTGELEKRGIHAHIGRLTLNPLRGLVAKEVRINHPRENWVLANISEVAFDIDYSGLVHGQQFVKAVDLRGARLSLPLDPADRNSERLDVSRLNARILLPPNKLDFDAEAELHGLRVVVSGRLLNPGTVRAAMPKDSSGGAAAGRMHEVLRGLNNLKIIGGRPELEVECSGDLANPSQLTVKGLFHSDRFTVDSGYEVRSARIAATYAEGRISLNQCAIADKLGELDASGTFRLETGEAVFQLRSTLDLQGLAHSLRLTQKVDEFVFYAPPLLELSGEAALPGGEEDRPLKGKMTGKFSVGRFAARSVMFEGASTEFAWDWDGGRWFVRDARLSHRSGNLLLSAMQVPGEFRFSLESGINPKVLPPLLPRIAGEILGEWDFPAVPRFRLEGRAPSLSFEGMEAEGTVAFGATRFRKVGFNSLVAGIRLKDEQLTFSDFVLERPEGKGTGAFIYDLKRNIATLKGVKSTMTPVDVAVWVDKAGDLPRHVAPYRFRTRPSLLIDGSVQIHGDDHTRLRIDVDGTNLDYHFINRDLFFPKIKGTLWVVGKRLKIEGLDGSIFGGKVLGNADISLSKKEGDYHGEVRVEDIDFPKLTKLYLDYESSQGKLRGNYKFAGRGEDVRALSGTGALSLSDGYVFGIPLFGPLSGILNTILPGAGYNTARKATATFDMKDGMIHTGDLMVDGKGFAMYGGGKLFFLDDKIDFNIRINAQGPAGLLFAPVSHLFEYVSDATLSKPVWRPRRLPKGMFKPTQ